MSEGETGIDPRQIGSLALAYMGDAIIECYVREAVIASGTTNPYRLQSKAVSYVSARAQAFFLHELTAGRFLTDEEQRIVKRGRNARSHSIPKNTDVQTYHLSTGFEALIGYLHFSNKKSRIDEIMAWIFLNHPVERGRDS